ncbi:MAG: HAD family hydrolase [Thermoplasmata archaeon]
MSPSGQGRRFRAILFDFFGTLATSETQDEAHLRLMESLVERYHLTTEPSILLNEFNSFLRAPLGRRSVWTPHRELVRNALSMLVGGIGGGTVRIGEEDRDWFYSEYLNHHKAFVRLHDGAREVLERVRAEGAYIGLLADADTAYIEKQLVWLNLCGLFDSVTTAEEVGASKPDPRIFKVALGKAGCGGNRAIFIGSAPGEELEVARSFGMTTILVDHRMSATDLTGADFVASHMSRVGTILIELLYQPMV